MRKELVIPDAIADRADKLAARRGIAFNALVIQALIREIGDDRLQKHVRQRGRPKSDTASDFLKGKS